MAAGLNNGVKTPFAARLRSLRRRAGLSQEELANRAGLTAKGIGALERGERQRPYPDTLRRLAEALELSEAERAELFDSVPPRGGDTPGDDGGAADIIAEPVLPGYLDPLIGREDDTAEVLRLLRDPDVRLLTLTGPGGVGKTRLALHAAAGAGDQFPDGVVFVPLAPLREPGLVIMAIAQALGVRETSGQPLADLVVAALHERTLLLLLDNFEHLIAAAPRVTEVLLPCPGVKALITSRAALRVRGEQEYHVPPLIVEDASRHDVGSAPSPTTYHPSPPPAVRLFVARARAVQPDFTLSAENAPTVAAICRRLDGLPLAIELAAARSNVLPPAMLLAGLDRALPLLAGGPRDLPARLRTMRDAIGWSYDLLSPQEQSFFRQLGIFTGGFTIAAAERVGGRQAEVGSAPPDDPLPSDPSPTRALDTLSALIGHSLVRRLPSAGPEPRFGMLETIREYAREQLVAREELAAAQQRHAAWFLALAERAEPHLTGPEQQSWLDYLETEHDNLRAALAWSVESNEIATGLRLATALMWFWHVRGHLSEGRQWLERTAELACPDGSLVGLRARALSGAGYLAAHRGEFSAALALGEAGLAIARAVGDKQETAQALSRLATVASQRRENDRPAALFAEALEVYREIGDRHGMAFALNSLGLIANERGQPEQAAPNLEEALAIFREIGDHRGIGVALGNLGRSATARGELEQAAAYHAEALALHRDVGYTWGAACELDRLAEISRRQGDLTRARALFAESLHLWRTIDDPIELAVWLDQFAELELASGHPEAAAVALGAAAAARRQAGHAGTDADAQSEVAGAVRDALGEEAFLAACDAGRSRPLAEMLDEAYAALVAPDASPASTS